MNRVQSRLVEEIIMVEDFNINKIQFYKGNEKTGEEVVKKSGRLETRVVLTMFIQILFNSFPTFLKHGGFMWKRTCFALSS